MNRLKIVLAVLFALLVFAFLSYALPSRETVRITNTYNKLTELGWNKAFFAGADTGTVENAQGQRDIRFIDTVKPNGKPRVYRNEDTGTIWPPYFKYDSSNLHAIAGDLRSTSENPKWVNITSYGWRVSMLSIYPNAISIRPVAGPDVSPINWPSMVILAVLGAILLLVWRMWNQFRERSLDPAVDRIDQRFDATRDRFEARSRDTRGRLNRWWNRK